MTPSRERSSGNVTNVNSRSKAVISNADQHTYVRQAYRVTKIPRKRLEVASRLVNGPLEIGECIGKWLERL